MCSKPKLTRKIGSEYPQNEKMSGVAAAFQYTLPVYRETDGCSYIEFYAYDPERGQMRRKRIKTNRIKGTVKRKQYVRDVIKRLIGQLNHGWNPWIAKDVTDLFIFEEGVTRYEAHIEKMLANGYFRKETYDGYKSNIKILREYIKKNPVYYMYQFDRTFCVDFLDYVFIERNNGAQTRNNYLNFLRVLSGFFVEKGFLKSKPTDGINPISKRLYTKERDCIPLEAVARLADYCKENDPHFLFACYLLYYCFIRPVEMTRLKVRDINIKEGTLTIPGNASKNRQTQTVTLPKKVLLYGIEIGIFTGAMDDYLFSDGLKPGKRMIDTKIFRDHWAKAHKVLKLKKEWKFYSLKDTGITEMCDNHVAPREVKDQARHSSLAITNIYLEKSKGRTSANKDILGYDGAL